MWLKVRVINLKKEKPYYQFSDGIIRVNEIVSMEDITFENIDIVEATHVTFSNGKEMFINSTVENWSDIICRVEERGRR